MISHTCCSFARRAKGGVEGATATLLNMVLKHLEGSKTRGKLLFIDFSSAFNLIQTHILPNKYIANFNLDLNMMEYDLHFHPDNPQGKSQWIPL